MQATISERHLDSRPYSFRDVFFHILRQDMFGPKFPAQPWSLSNRKGIARVATAPPPLALHSSKVCASP